MSDADDIIELDPESKIHLKTLKRKKNSVYMGLEVDDYPLWAAPICNIIGKTLHVAGIDVIFPENDEMPFPHLDMHIVCKAKNCKSTKLKGYVAGILKDIAKEAKKIGLDKAVTNSYEKVFGCKPGKEKQHINSRTIPLTESGEPNVYLSMSDREPNILYASADIDCSDAFLERLHTILEEGLHDKGLDIHGGIEDVESHKFVRLEVTPGFSAEQNWNHRKLLSDAAKVVMPHKVELARLIGAKDVGDEAKFAPETQDEDPPAKLHAKHPRIGPSQLPEKKEKSVIGLLEQKLEEHIVKVLTDLNIVDATLNSWAIQFSRELIKAHPERPPEAVGPVKTGEVITSDPLYEWIGEALQNNTIRGNEAVKHWIEAIALARKQALEKKFSDNPGGLAEAVKNEPIAKRNALNRMLFNAVESAYAEVAQAKAAGIG